MVIKNFVLDDDYAPPIGGSIFPQHGGYGRVRYIDQETGEPCFEFLHRLVWEHYNGPIPEDHCIHHIDGDITNNRISNLACVAKDDHSRMHRLHPELSSPQCRERYQKHRDRNREQYARTRAPKRRQKRQQKKLEMLNVAEGAGTL
jgi:hypothetical protein